MNKNIFIILIGFMTACTTIGAPQSIPQQHILQFPERTLADWQPDRAVEEAKKDIRLGKLKIYISGTIAAYSPGVKKENYPLIIDLPRADAGVGCIVEDAELRKVQFEYARKYNEYIVNYLLQK